jgi:hypothetical protein
MNNIAKLIIVESVKRGFTLHTSKHHQHRLDIFEKVQEHEKHGVNLFA